MALKEARIKEEKEKEVCKICYLTFDPISIESLKKHNLSEHQVGKWKLCMHCDYKTEGSVVTVVEFLSDSDGIKQYFAS